MSIRHFLQLNDLSKVELRELILRAIELKARHKAGIPHRPLMGKTLGMIFEKSSTRTRVSFEAGMLQLGGHALFLSSRDIQLGRGEPVTDTARVLSRMLDGIMIRANSHQEVVQFSEVSTAPVINGLTDFNHPCQLLADMQTYFEHRGDIAGKTVTWIGDGNNVFHSFVLAAEMLEFTLRIAHPEGFAPDQNLIASADADVSQFADPLEAASGADLIVTDVWASMGQEDEQQQRIQAFANYQVDDKVMSRAHRDALFMHCLPAHRGEEVSASVIDGEHSVVWDEAENRLHAQKALLEFLLA